MPIRIAPTSSTGATAMPTNNKVPGMNQAIDTSNVSPAVGDGMVDRMEEGRSRGGDDISFYVAFDPQSESEKTGVEEYDPITFAKDWGMSQFEFSDIIGMFLDEKAAQLAHDNFLRERQIAEQNLEEKKSTAVEKIKKAIDKLEKKRKQHIDAMKENPKNASQHRQHIAELAGKIDDLVTKMERVENAKKPVNDAVLPEKKAVNEDTKATKAKKVSDFQKQFSRDKAAGFDPAKSKKMAKAEKDSAKAKKIDDFQKQFSRDKAAGFDPAKSKKMAKKK
jgi:hypothetical protein